MTDPANAWKVDLSLANIHLAYLQSHYPDRVITNEWVNQQNWIEAFNVDVDDETSPEIEQAVKDAFTPYIGKTYSDLPDTITVWIHDENSLPHAWQPFSHWLPFIPNPGVNPSTGDTPIDTVLDAAGAILALGRVFQNFLGFAFTPPGLALIGGVVILYIGFKGIMGANQEGAKT